MTPNAVRRKLKQIQILKKEVAIITEQILETRAKAEGAGGFKTEFVPISGYVTSKIEDYVAQIAEYENKLLTKRMALLTAIDNAEALLELLNDQDGILRSVLRLIYLFGKTQEDAARELCYSERQIRRFEWMAVCKIAKRTN